MRTKPVTEEGEYMRSLPKKRVGAGALYINSKDEILLVKPNYKQEWLIPGGTVDLNESPQAACTREVKEEIGLVLQDPRLLCVRYSPDTKGYGDGLLFVFEGGVLTDDMIQEVVLEVEEHDEYRFVSIKDAVPLLSPGSLMAVTAALEALKTNSCTYVELQS